MASSMVTTGMSITTTSLQSIYNGSPSKQIGSCTGAPAMAVSTNSRGTVCCALKEEASASAEHVAFGRREALMSGMTALIAGMSMTGPAFADFDEDYISETEAVIQRIKSTLALEKTDPTKADAVATLRQSSNDWVAKYRREKSIAGRPSFSNMYSVLNAISGHYISFGPNYPIPSKRKERILEEIRDAEKALKRGR
ncbi:unnamed protein product [Calypogeia fissa]